ncbi:MAG: zinc ribbon domain-containing protein [Actinobacteria bacterium]|nr:zinc ribbon domain-containing protein [Actinomycetota bacterium]
MPYCNSCGKEIDASTTFCPYCGVEVAVPVPTFEQPSPPSITQPGPPDIPAPPLQQTGPAGFPPPPYTASPSGTPAPPYQQENYPSYVHAAERSKAQLAIGLMGIGSMTLSLLASFLPWASFFGISANGLDGDGKITVVTALLAGVFFAIAVAAKVKWPYIISLILALITAAVFLVNFVDISDTVGMSAVSFGMYVGITGACAGTVFSILGLAVKK